MPKKRLTPTTQMSLPQGGEGCKIGREPGGADLFSKSAAFHSGNKEEQAAESEMQNSELSPAGLGLE
jgi:hypothetical protein